MTLKKAGDLPAQHSSFAKGHTASSSGSLIPVPPDGETSPSRSRQTPHKEELRMTSDRYPSGMKITEEETGSKCYCSAAPVGDPQASRVWSGPPAVLQQRGLTVRKKTKKQKEITSSSTIWTSTQRPNLKISNYTDDRWINPQTWEETSAKRRKTTEPRTPHLLQGITTPHQQGNKARWRMSVMNWQNQASEGG